MVDYASTKAAIVGFTRSLSKQLVKRGFGLMLLHTVFSFPGGVTVKMGFYRVDGIVLYGNLVFSRVEVHHQLWSIRLLMRAQLYTVNG